MTARPTAFDEPGPAADALIDWHLRQGRTFAFRDSTDPWHVLVAEVMSQQTQVARVEERIPAFLASYPSPAALAEATTGEVLRAWAGLGYNRRAIALRECARRIVERHRGVVPADVAALQALPGIGPYSARAVAARAFGLPVAGLDVNVRRVVTRLAGVPLAPRVLQDAADLLVPRDRAGIWTDAAMDLAATVCRATPACAACPIRAWCATGSDEVGGSTAAQPGRPRRTPVEAPNGEPRRTPVKSPVPRARDGREPFAATRRWLRGRLVAELRDAPDGAWIPVGGPRGQHGSLAVSETFAQLEREGLVELDGEGRARLRP